MASSIGTLGEKSLHAGLKEWYRRPGDRVEARLGRYVIDLVRGDLLVEFQTRSFSSMRRKLAALTETRLVRLVHPVALKRWIVRMRPGEDLPLGRRLSPKRGVPGAIFEELVSIPHLALRDNLSIELLLIHEEEVRLDDGQGSRWRRGWSILDRRLLEVKETIHLESAADFLALLPAGLEHPFTNRDLAEASGWPVRLAEKATYSLRKMGILQASAKRRGALLHTLAPAAPAAHAHAG